MLSTDVRPKLTLIQKLKKFCGSKHSGEVMAKRPIGAELIGSQSPHTKSLKTPAAWSFAASKGGASSKCSGHSMPTSASFHNRLRSNSGW
jgi:hypothetical protein